jgi:hypothetical protein
MHLMLASFVAARGITSFQLVSFAPMRARLHFLILCIFVIFVASALSGCGSVSRDAEETKVTAEASKNSEDLTIKVYEWSGNVDTVDLQGHGDVLISQSGKQSVKVEADKKIMSFIKVNVKKAGIFVKVKDNKRTHNKRIKIRIALKNLYQLDNHGAFDIAISGLKLQRTVGLVMPLQINNSGSGDIRIDKLDAQELEVKNSGSGNFKLSGKADRQEVKNSGSMDYLADKLTSQECFLTSDGSINSRMNCKILKKDISGSGSVKNKTRDK